MNKLATFMQALLLSLALSVAAFASDGKVDINRADAATLSAELSGIGPAKAEAIVAWRQANGPFRSIDQLAEVKGIGLASVERIRDRITLGPAEQPTAPVDAAAATDTADRE